MQRLMRSQRFVGLTKVSVNVQVADFTPVTRLQNSETVWCVRHWKLQQGTTKEFRIERRTRNLVASTMVL